MFYNIFPKAKVAYGTKSYIQLEALVDKNVAYH